MFGVRSVNVGTTAGIVNHGHLSRIFLLGFVVLGNLWILGVVFRVES